jgi:hypothetical protein
MLWLRDYQILSRSIMRMFAGLAAFHRSAQQGTAADAFARLSFGVEARDECILEP